MIVEHLASRRIGRTYLYVSTTERSTLAFGRQRQGNASDTVYAVRAAAVQSRNGIELGAFPTLAAAEEFLYSYSPAYGLTTKG